jgi:hypothetical protein
MWHSLQYFQGSFSPDSGQIPGSGGFQNKLICPGMIKFMGNQKNKRLDQNVFIAETA